MKNILLHTVLIPACLFAAGVASAQTLRSSYFLESMPMRHKLNPALVSDRGYISLPGVGDINAGVHANVGLTTFLYPLPNGKLTTFMNPIVPAEEFLRKIKNRNAALVDADVTVLSTGFYAWNGFNTIDIGVRSMTDVNLPGQLFRFMKEGLAATEGSFYQLRDLSVQTDNYIEIGLGHARPVNDRLTLGGKLKVLLGVGSARSTIDRMDVLMTQDKWEVNANGYLDVSAAGASFGTKPDGEINKINYKNPGVGGWGLAIDLGMSYVLVEDHLFLSAAVNDLGFLSWFKNLRGVTHNESFLFDGFNNLVVDDPDNPGSFKEQWKNLKDDLRDLVRFYEAPAPDRLTRMLHSTVRAGLEYAILDKKISFGLLSTTRFGLPKIWTEGMLSANFQPCRWFTATVTGSATNYGLGWGWLLNFTPKGLTLFIGSDYMVTRVTPQWIPMGNATASFNMGINIPIGARRDRHFERI